MSEKTSRSKRVRNWHRDHCRNHEEPLSLRTWARTTAARVLGERAQACQWLVNKGLRETL